MTAGERFFLFVGASIAIRVALFFLLDRKQRQRAEAAAAREEREWEVAKRAVLTRPRQVGEARETPATDDGTAAAEAAVARIRRLRRANLIATGIGLGLSCVAGVAGLTLGLVLRMGGQLALLAGFWSFGLTATAVYRRIEPKEDPLADD